MRDYFENNHHLLPCYHDTSEPLPHKGTGEPPPPRTGRRVSRLFHTQAPRPRKRAAAAAHGRGRATGTRASSRRRHASCRRWRAWRPPVPAARRCTHTPSRAARRIVVLDDDCISVLGSDLGSHLGCWTASMARRRRTSPSRWMVKCSARSLVFRAQPFGTMADARMDCITLHGVRPAAFRILMRFMYTNDALRMPTEGYF